MLQPWAPGDRHRPPPACLPGEGVSISVLARPKLSYAPPGLPLIWIRRTGFGFEHFTSAAPAEQPALDQADLQRQLSEDAWALVRALWHAAQADPPVHHGRTAIRDGALAVTVPERRRRAALAYALSTGLLIEGSRLNEGKGRGGAVLLVPDDIAAELEA